MKTKFTRPAASLAIAVLGLLVLSACSGVAAGQPAAFPEPIPARQGLPGDAAAAPQAAPLASGWVLDVPRLDSQGAVSVEVTPLNLNVPGHTLDFSVALNTHSVDLSMDLAGLAFLVTDTGQQLQAAVWEAPRGGHHVQGILKFPAVQDGAGVMEGVNRLTLVIRDLDAAERTFVWER